MGKPYTWDEISTFLKKELSKSKHIMTFGTFGSLDVENDVDLFITKKPISPSALFYKEVHALFNNLNKFIYTNYKLRIIFFFGCEPETLKLSNYTKKDLAIHRFVYTSFPQIEKDWNWALFPNENLKSFFEEKYFCLLGKPKDLFSKDFQKGLYYDNIFVYLNLYDRINSNYPDKFLVEVMSYYYDYLFRKRLKLRTPIIKNKQDVVACFYNLCEELDRLEKDKA